MQKNNYATPWRSQAAPDEILVKQKIYMLTDVQPALHNYFVFVIMADFWDHYKKD